MNQSNIFLAILTLQFFSKEDKRNVIMHINKVQWRKITAIVSEFLHSGYHSKTTNYYQQIAQHFLLGNECYSNYKDSHKIQNTFESMIVKLITVFVKGVLQANIDLYNIHFIYC